MEQDAEQFKQKCLSAISIRLQIVKKQSENKDNSDYISTYLSSYIAALEDIQKDIKNIDAE